jgi:hypothetical protein
MLLCRWCEVAVCCSVCCRAWCVCRSRWNQIIYHIHTRVSPPPLQTVVIATVAPMERSVEETVSTLAFADRAKRVMVKARVNEVVNESLLLEKAREEISRLQLELRHAR